MWGEQPVIPQSHHHSALQCQLWMWEVSEAGFHIFLSLAQPQEGVPRACLWESAGVLDGKPSSGIGNSSHGGSSKVTPKKNSKAPAANSSQPSPHHSRWETSHYHKSHKKGSGGKKKKIKDVSLAGKSSSHKVCH